MLSLESLRKIEDPELVGLSDEEILKLRDILYIFIENVLDNYLKTSNIE